MRSISFVDVPLGDLQPGGLGDDLLQALGDLPVGEPFSPTDKDVVWLCQQRSYPGVGRLRVAEPPMRRSQVKSILTEKSQYIKQAPIG